jgi:hypothetical protein
MLAASTKAAPIERAALVRIESELEVTVRA